MTKQKLYKLSLSDINDSKDVSYWTTDWLLLHADHKLVYIDDREDLGIVYYYFQEMGELFLITDDPNLAFQFSLRWGVSSSSILEVKNVTVA